MSAKPINLQTQPALESEDRWEAIRTRDHHYDGAFVFAVRSTGVYCRPSCPSRRPRPEQVIFFSAPDAAEREGFRPCRRCRPRAGARHPQAELAQRLCRHIETRVIAHPDEPLTLASLGAEIGMSQHHLERVFKRAMGISPRQYADAQRLVRLKTLLRKGDDVTTALYEVGYGSSSRLYERAPAHLGMTPATYRCGGRGMRIGYTIVPCPLGRLLVAATEKGISAVYLGDHDHPLEAALTKEYPAAQIFRDRNGLREWVSALLRHLRGQEPHLQLPLDVQATAFQRRVWEELKRIPYGSTRSYSEIARAIGRPSATRAVARACATNPVSIVVPCHRVVRGDGNLAGYRWGLGRKQALLEHESRARKRLPASKRP
jgi:AraC family transcriptional regulator, regulatory protein of adaptative response / methylated-DNA-[protein]-cysteine methyltransferase